MAPVTILREMGPPKTSTTTTTYLQWQVVWSSSSLPPGSTCSRSWSRWQCWNYRSPGSKISTSPAIIHQHSTHSSLERLMPDQKKKQDRSGIMNWLMKMELKIVEEKERERERSGGGKEREMKKTQDWREWEKSEEQRMEAKWKKVEKSSEDSVWRGLNKEPKQKREIWRFTYCFCNSLKKPLSLFFIGWPLKYKKLVCLITSRERAGMCEADEGTYPKVSFIFTLLLCVFCPRLRDTKSMLKWTDIKWITGIYFF